MTKSAFDLDRAEKVFPRPRPRPRLTVGAVVWRLVTIGVFLYVFWLVLSMRGLAHDALPTAGNPLGWTYNNACCSGHDCAPLPPGAVVGISSGWFIPATGETIPYSDPRVRDSGDSDFHRCSPNGTTTRCLYVPPQAF